MTTAERIVKQRAIAAGTYTFDQLADVYNQARVDYIVPMPMNGKRMKEYVHNYDIDLSVSMVTQLKPYRKKKWQETGVIMLGVRGDRSWVTRLGVIPKWRGHHIGQFCMEKMIENSLALWCRHIQLEVIVGNVRARTLFKKLGFQDVRELMVIRRPPGHLAQLEEVPPIRELRFLETEAIPSYLKQRDFMPAWTEETLSLINAGSLEGIEIVLEDGELGWLIYQSTPFQLTHFVFSPSASPSLIRALLAYVHKQNPLKDTKLENIPTWISYMHVFREMGYVEEFRRTEMILPL